MAERPLSPEEGAMYMEMCAALIAMTGQDEVFIPEGKLPMTPFAIWRRAADDQEEGRGLIVRFVPDKPQ